MEHPEAIKYQLSIFSSDGLASCSLQKIRFKEERFDQSSVRLSFRSTPGIPSHFLAASRSVTHFKCLTWSLSILFSRRYTCRPFLSHRKSIVPWLSHQSSFLFIPANPGAVLCLPFPSALVTQSFAFSFHYVDPREIAASVFRIISITKGIVVVRVGECVFWG